MKESHYIILIAGPSPSDWSLEVPLEMFLVWSSAGDESVSVLCGAPRSSEVEDTALY